MHLLSKDVATYILMSVNLHLLQVRCLGMATLCAQVVVITASSSGTTGPCPMIDLFASTWDIPRKCVDYDGHLTTNCWLPVEMTTE